ncbi:MAG: TRAP transporter small permease [Desulfopila sp.]
MPAPTDSSTSIRQNEAGENFTPGAVERVIRPVLAVFEWVARIITLFVLASTSYGVFMRYAMNDPSRWIEELTGYMVIGLVVFGAPVTLLNNSHIEVDLLTGSLTGRAKKIVRLWAMLSVILFCWAVIVSGWRAARLSYLLGMHGEGYIEAPLWIPQGTMSIGFILLLIAAIARICSLMTKEKTSC